jgi:hypothetical protein
MDETLTVTLLGITGKLKLTLQSTNPCESIDPPQRQALAQWGDVPALDRGRDARG